MKAWAAGTVAVAGGATWGAQGAEGEDEGTRETARAVDWGWEAVTATAAAWVETAAATAG